MWKILVHVLEALAGGLFGGYVLGVPKRRRVFWGLLWRSPLWMGMILLNIILLFLGFLFIPLALTLWATRHEVPSKYYLGAYLSTWKWGWLQWLWGNEEDGIDGLVIMYGKIKNQNWTAKCQDWSYFRTCFVWSAWRNSANNFRFTRIGRSPDYGSATNFDKDEFAFITKGLKFFLQVPLSKTEPYYILWLGWKPGFGVGFKSTITSLEKQGA